MCVNLTQYPLVELTDGKKKVLFNYGKAIENKDFSSNWSFVREVRDWNYAIKGNPLARESTLYAVKKYGISKFIKYTSVPCGKCEDCLKSKARGWAFRILKEASLYENNYFITFTYDDEHIKYNCIKNNVVVQTLVKNEISVFNKKLKTYLNRKGLNSDFRFYGVGEYGLKSGRPHYHVIYFNLNIPDLSFFTHNDNGDLLFKSDFISSIWNKGNVLIGALDIGSACYVARYCDKKLNRTDNEKFLISSYGLQPEFSVMSRRPGIGSFYLDKIIDNLKHGIYQVYSNGNEFAIPLYYSKKVKELLDASTLKEYEERNNFLIKAKFGRDLLLSDCLATDLQSYYIAEDIYKKSCKKLRDNIKFY